MTSRQKQSLILGALTSSFGIFLSKALGLLYAAPFSSLAGEANMSFYATSYNYYNLLLNICTAGIPFAVATMVAKYHDKQDYRTVLVIRKLSSSILLVSGVVVGLIFVLVSKPFAGIVLGSMASDTDIDILRNVFCILAIAVMIVPFLSGQRGFQQGLKELKVYSFSQVLEQLVRVLFLLAGSVVCVLLLKIDSVYALYAGVFAASISAFVTIIYLKKFDKKHLDEIQKLAKLQPYKKIEKKSLVKEFLWFGAPYVLIATLGDSTNLVNSSFFMNAMTDAGHAYEESKLLLGMIQFNAVKLIAIPQVLALGFSAGIVPYITITYENNRYNELRKNITDVLDTVIYISLPLCFCLLVLARPIYNLMYGDLNLDLGSNVLMWSSSLAFLGTLAPVCSSLMMNLRMRKKVIFFLLLNFVVKLVTFFPLIALIGYPGAIVSSIISSLVNISLALYTMGKMYHINYIKLMARILIMICGLLA
ncbi:MAG: oligosaccharide flippase family protein, partial [Erysipelotrichaceae bacterium]